MIFVIISGVVHKPKETHRNLYNFPLNLNLRYFWYVFAIEIVLNAFDNSNVARNAFFNRFLKIVLLFSSIN